MTALSVHNHLARADELRRLQRYDLALREVQHALALDPLASAAHVCAAWILHDQKRLPAAEQAARAGLAAEPNDPDAQHVLAVTLWQQGRREEARQAFDVALALVGGQSALYLTNYARMLTSYAAYQEALIALNFADQALALAPLFADPHEIRGLALRQLGRDVEADVAFRTALQISPQSFSAQHNLGLHDLTLGRAPAALEHFREALRLNPNSEIARRNLVLALKARNPLYPRVLSVMLRSQQPDGQRLFNWLLRGFVALFAIAAVLAFVKPSIGEPLFALWGWCGVTLLVCSLVRLVWFTAIDPIFNTLLLLDPQGRQAVEYDAADGVVAGGVVALLLGLVGTALSFALLGSAHPVSEATFMLCLAALPATIFAAAIRSTGGRGRRLAWIGYALIIIALLSIGAAQLASGAGLDSMAEMLYILMGLLFPLGLVVYLIGRASANAVS